MTSPASDARSKAVQAALQRQQAAVSPASSSSAASPAPFTSTDPLRSLIIFVVGAPGSGKTTQCAALAAQHAAHHVIFDDFLRQALRYADAKLSKKRTSTSSSFVPALSSSQLSHLLRAHQSKQVIPSSIRARILYSAMQYQSSQRPLFRFLVDGYLDSEDDWNEYAALIEKRKEERDQQAVGSQAAMAIGFLPPIIIRLVCSESVGQLRWRRQLLIDNDKKLSGGASGTPSQSEVKARSMKYSLKTRPLIYRLGMVSAELRREEKSGGGGSSEDDEDDDDLAVIHGMIVKRVDAEGSIAQCYADMAHLFQQISAHTLDANWTRIAGYDSDEDDTLPGLPPVTTATALPPASSSPPTVASVAAVPAPAPSSLAPPPASEPESDSPTAVNWQNDPDEDPEESERLQRFQRMLRLIEAEEDKYRLEQEALEAKEKAKMEAELAKLRHREELVEAEQGHIRTRRDDRFITFISVTIAVSMVSVKEGDGSLWVELYRGFSMDGTSDVRWLRVLRTSKLPITSNSIAFPRAIVNTWKLSGNERERPVMFRLYHAPHNKPTVTVGESRTMLQHLLAPPEEKGLTLTLRKATVQQPLGYLLVSPAALHLLLKPNKIIPPSKLHTVGQERVIIPATIPLTPSNVNSNVSSPVVSPPESPKTRPIGKSEPLNATERKDERSERKRTKSVSEKSGKVRDRQDDAEMEGVLREMDEQLGLTGPRPRRFSFDARATEPAESKQPVPSPAPVPQPSIVSEARTSISRLSIQALPPSLPGVRQAKLSKADRIKRDLLEARRKRKLAEAKALKARAASRERRRKELARIKKNAQVSRVSLLSVDCAAMNLPKQGLFNEGKFYLQVYRRRDKLKEREKQVKQAKGKKLRQSIKVPDMFPPGSANHCLARSQKHLIKPALWSLAYSSPIIAALSPDFQDFLLPIDDQPLLFVVLSAQCGHRHDVVNERLREHEGKDRVVGLARLSVEDMVKMAMIQQREWEVEVYRVVEVEKEKEKRRERLLREMERRRERGEHVEEQWEEDHDRQQEEVERAANDQNRVSVILKDVATLEREREARKAKRAEKAKRAGIAPVPVGADADDSSDDSDDEEAAPATVSPAVPLLSFFSLAFFTTRPVKPTEMGLVHYTGKERRESKSVGGGGGGAGASQGPAAPTAAVVPGKAPSFVVSAK